MESKGVILTRIPVMKKIPLPFDRTVICGHDKRHIDTDCAGCKWQFWKKEGD